MGSQLWDSTVGLNCGPQLWAQLWGSAVGDFYRSSATRTKCRDPIDTAETAAVASIIKISEIGPAYADVPYTGVPRGRNGKDLSPIFGGNIYKKTGDLDAEADKAAADMAREMED